MVKPISTQAIEANTETSWAEWCAFLDASHAAKLDHNAIVKIAREYRTISGWWAQSVAVAYEQHIGRRKPGQTSDGLFSASISRTIDGELGTIHTTWCNFASDLMLVDDQEFLRPPTTSATPKRLYWRCKFEDKGSAAMSMEAKGNIKVLIVVEHKSLEHESDVEKKKQSWSELLARCFNN